jgi:hypothetical protein
MRKKSNRSHKTPMVISMIVVLVAIAGGFYLFWHKNNPENLINDTGATTVRGSTSTPITKPVQPQASSTSPENGQIGGSTDNSGKTTDTLPNPTSWVSSNNGDITLQEPSPNGTLESGDSIVGTAKVSAVQFILSDNAVGLIAQGSLKVVNGKFSGALNFTTHSTSGVLQVYYPNPNNGAEEDIIEVNVSFNN